MERRMFSREFKLEAVKLVRERGVSFAQASRDLDLAESVLRRWAREAVADPLQAFPGQGQVKPEQQEITQLKREVARLKAERDILKNEIGPVGPPMAVETVRYMVGLRGAAEGFLVD